MGCFKELVAVLLTCGLLLLTVGDSGPRFASTQFSRAAVFEILKHARELRVLIFTSFNIICRACCHFRPFLVRDLAFERFFLKDFNKDFYKEIDMV